MYKRQDGALLDVIKIDEALYRQAQQAVSCYGITLIEYLELCFQKLKLLPQDNLKDCLTRLAAESRMPVSYTHLDVYKRQTFTYIFIYTVGEH